MPMTTAAEAMNRGSPSAVDERVGDVGELGEAARQVDVGQHHAGHGGDARGDVERPVDRRQAVLARLGPGEVDAAHRGQRADGRDQQREHEALVAEGLRAEDQRGDQGDGVRLEEVGGHAGAVADVVAHVVGDRRGVARVVLGDVLLDLADQVGADVGGLGEDAAADTHEHGEQGGAEAEALEHVGGLVLEEQHDEAGAEQAEADGEHADHGAGAEADLHGRLAAARSRPRRRRGGWPARRGTCRGSRPSRRSRRRPGRTRSGRSARWCRRPAARAARRTRSRRRWPSVRNCRVR